MARTGSARWDGGDLYELSEAAQALRGGALYNPKGTPDLLCAALLRVHTAAEAVTAGPVPDAIMVELDGVRTTGAGGRRASRPEGAGRRRIMTRGEGIGGSPDAPPPPDAGAAQPHPTHHRAPRR
jgi:hypothetical protein